MSNCYWLTWKSLLHLFAEVSKTSCAGLRNWNVAISLANVVPENWSTPPKLEWKLKLLRGWIAMALQLWKTFRCCSVFYEFRDWMQDNPFNLKLCSFLFVSLQISKVLHIYLVFFLVFSFFVTSNQFHFNPCIPLSHNYDYHFDWKFLPSASN